MKKWYVYVILSLLCMTLLGCTHKVPNEEKEVQVDSEESSIEENKEEEIPEMIEITEKMYVSYINEIYTNPEDYISKKIKLEGMYMSGEDEQNGNTYYFVYRRGPGCCNNDGSMCGFEFTTDESLPQENDWIEVVGTLEQYQEDGIDYLHLANCHLTIKTERGLEDVSQ